MSEIMMATPLVPMVLSGEKTQTRRMGSRWTKVKPGDVLAMREAWAIAGDCGVFPPPPERRIYRADYPACVHPSLENVPPIQQVKWTPAVHMPLELVRVHLHVVRVWQEYVESITEADARAEGMAGLTLDGLVQLAGGSESRVRKVWGLVDDWRSIETLIWPKLPCWRRFELVAAVLGANRADTVTAIEFKAVRV